MFTIPTPQERGEGGKVLGICGEAGAYKDTDAILWHLESFHGGQSRYEYSWIPDMVRRATVSTGRVMVWFESIVQSALCGDREAQLHEVYNAAQERGFVLAPHDATLNLVMRQHRPAYDRVVVGMIPILVPMHGLAIFTLASDGRLGARAGRENVVFEPQTMWLFARGPNM